MSRRTAWGKALSVIGAHKALAVDCCRDVGYKRLYVSLHRVLPLLVIRRGAFVAALVVLIELIGLS